ncbi:MAG: DUF2974 domain-containing protein [Lachnospiraceae bacterium]|nr:DUF2974 domain-containing protein [Lachnospiraceae bacterium]
MKNNIIGYIEKYGSVPFAEKAFNKVDALILSQFSYFKLDGIVPEVGQDLPSVTVKSIAGNDSVSDLFADERYRKVNMELFDAMAASERFGTIKLNHCINLINSRWEMQFSAVTFEMADGKCHVVFRGTDETLVGWKEDFNMSFMTPVPAQVKAVDYLHYAAERIKGSFTVGGHSKGGNLAVYSAMKCSPLVRDRIELIYSQDGPGFTKETLADAEFDAVSGRIRKYVPRSSIIGMMLQSQEEYKVIEARSVGILQHDPFNWVVEDDDFVYRDDVAGRYSISDASVNEWADRADPEEMKLFVDRMYDVFVASGVSDLNDFKGNWATIMPKMKTAVDNMDPEDKKRIKAVLAVFLDSIKDQLKDSLLGWL